MKKYVIALDQGTTSSRAIVFDREQNILGISQTWANAQLISTWFQGYAPLKPNQDFYQFVDQIRTFSILVAGGFLPAIKTDEDAAILADYFGSPYLLNITNVDYVYDSDPRYNLIIILIQIKYFSIH